jgi:polysaccharide export outer membrane protein
MHNLLMRDKPMQSARKLAIFLRVLPLMFALAGCASFPNSGPTMGPLVSGKPDPQMAINVIMLSPGDIGPYVIRPPRDLPASTRSPAAAQRYLIAPGDILNVTIFGTQFGSAIGTTNQSGGLFKSVVDGGNSFGPLPVSPSGTIMLPYINEIHVAGETTTGAQREIASLLASAKQIDQPSVLVSIVSSISLVHVSGDVKTPGDFALIDGPETVLDAINKAGGPNQSALQSDVVVRRAGQIYQMPMEKLLLGGGDMPLQAGDDIVVQSHPMNFFAMGALNHDGSFPFLSRSPSLLDALGQIGGLVDTQSDPTGVFVFRQPVGSDVMTAQPTVFVLDFSRPTALFLAGEFALQPEDTIYVTNAPLYQAGKVIGIVSSTGGLVRNGTAFTSP